MAIALLRISAVVYVLTTLLVMLHIFRPKANGERRVLVMIQTAVVFHALAVGGRITEVAAFPLADAHDALSLFGFISVMIALAVAVRGGTPQVAWLATPLVAVMVCIASAFEPSTVVPESLKSGWLSLHIGLALLGDSAFVIAGLVASLYLLQERRLKRKKRKKGRNKSKRKQSNDHWSSATGMQHLPALEALDKVNVWLFKIGFPLMTLGILTGIFYGKETIGRYWTWDARNTVSAVVWLMYAAMLYARLVIGWRGRKSAWLTIVGLIAILLTFVGLGLGGTTVHGQEHLG